MRRRIQVCQLLILLISAVLIAGCSSTQSATGYKMDRPFEIAENGYQVSPADQTNQSNIIVHPNRDRPSNLTLNDLMIKLPGVSVIDRGPNSRIKVNGMASSFIANTDPLFVVNGQTIGSDYATVFALVYPTDVISMSVLKGSDATIYGSRGANGVIVIRTR
jgi:TonB-dependent SusC/RagA subfamily outer membrane receptor